MADFVWTALCPAEPPAACAPMHAKTKAKFCAAWRRMPNNKQVRLVACAQKYIARAGVPIDVASLALKPLDAFHAAAVEAWSLGRVIEQMAARRQQRSPPPPSPAENEMIYVRCTDAWYARASEELLHADLIRTIERAGVCDD
jgi:hypothetical protein